MVVDDAFDRLPLEAETGRSPTEYRALVHIQEFTPVSDLSDFLSLTMFSVMIASFSCDKLGWTKVFL